MATAKQLVFAVLVLSFISEPSSAQDYASAEAEGDSLHPAWTKFKYLTGLGTLLSPASDTPGQAWPPSFCHDFDCPMYRQAGVPIHGNYEVRDYSASVWASTSGSNSLLDGTSMFMRLIRFIGGNNVEGTNIEMTVPVLAMKTVGWDGQLEDSKMMSFYIPDDITAPTPHDDSVIVHTMDDMRVYVRSFGGMASDADWMAHAAELETALDADGQSFDRDHYYCVKYDSPLKLTNRHNEVWYIAS